MGKTVEIGWWAKVTHKLMSYKHGYCYAYCDILIYYVTLCVPARWRLTSPRRFTIIMEWEQAFLVC